MTEEKRRDDKVDKILEKFKGRKLQDPSTLLILVAVAVAAYFYFFPTAEREERIDPEVAFHERVAAKEEHQDLEASEARIQKKLEEYQLTLEETAELREGQRRREQLERQNKELQDRLMSQQEGFPSRRLREEISAKSYYAPIMKAESDTPAAPVVHQAASSFEDDDLSRFREPRQASVLTAQGPVLPDQVEVRAGTWIPAILGNQLHAQVGGSGVATIREDVYSSDGRHVVIPKGSRAIIQFAKGEDQSYHLSALAVKEIILPNGEVRVLPIPVHDGMGKAGLDPRVDGRFKRHYLEKIGMSVLIAAISSVPALALDDNDGSRNQLAEYQFIENVSGSMAGILRESLSIPSEKIFDAGAHLNFFMLDSILLPPYDPSGVRRTRTDRMQEQLEALKNRQAANGTKADPVADLVRSGDISEAKKLIQRMLAESGKDGEGL